jgi:hypothetical protein
VPLTVSVKIRGTYIVEVNYTYTVPSLDAMGVESTDKFPNKRSSLFCREAALRVTAIDVQLCVVRTA